MIPNFTTNPYFTPAQKFLAEKLIELVFTKTIDTHRVRLNNPYTAMLEVKHVLSDWKAKKIRFFDKTVKPVIDEAYRLIKNDKTLQFAQVNEVWFTNLLRSAAEKDYLQLYYATNLLLNDNTQYLSNLFNTIENEINRINKLVTFNIWELTQLNLLLEYLACQLVTHGYSKRYLYTLFINSFSDSAALTFTDAFTGLKPLSTKAKEDYTVIFQLRKTGGKRKDVALNTPYELPGDEKDVYASLNEKAETFLSNTSQSFYFLRVNTEGCDFTTVIEKAKRELFTIKDLLHLGFPDKRFEFHNRCLVIGRDQPERANIQPINHLTDGNFRSHQDLYEHLQSKIEALLVKTNLEKESFQKVISAFRHLRLGTEADESEQQFINYWIGLEYIFSNYDIDESTIARLKEYFTMAHANVYLHRNLMEFCHDIERLQLQTSIPGFNTDLQFLKTTGAFNHIITTFSHTYPLLAFRAHTYKKILEDKNAKQVVSRHRQNLEWHLVRCYRIRNEIVHDAAIHLNIHSVTANLRYYLTFILTDLVHYLADASQDINMTGSVSIQDYFILQEIKYRNHEANSFQFDRLIDENSVTEVFS